MIFEGNATVLGNSQPITARHKLAGTVTVDGLPAKRAIMVFDRRVSVVVAATWSSGIDGAWLVYGLSEYPERSLLVVALDTTGNYNAAVADYISQVATVET